MSHLIIEQGKEVGREIAVPATGIKFGRSPANDLVLEDEALMLFQGRFFFKSDGTLWITDFSVGVKSHIDGVSIDERQLKVGDLVEVGSSAFRVISTRQESETAPVAPAAPAAQAPHGGEEEIDLGFKPARKKGGGSHAKGPEKRTSPMFRILQVLAVLLILLLVVVAATELTRPKRRAGNGVRMKGLFLDYERVRGGPDNIMRYALELTPAGDASLVVDDARNRHFTKSTRLSAEEMAELKDMVKESGFFQISSDRIGKARNQYDLDDLALACDGQFNHVRVLNRELPADLRRLTDRIDEFVFQALDVSRSLLMDDAMLIQYAKDAYKLGEDFYRERDSSFENLAQCIKHLRESINYLETLNPKPEPYEKAKKLLSTARVEQNERYKEYMFLVDKAMRVNDWSDAQRNLRICTQLISDRSDERFETIAAKTIAVEDKLR